MNDEFASKLNSMVDEQAHRLQTSGKRWTNYAFVISGIAVFAAGIMLYSASSIQPKDVYKEVQELQTKVDTLYDGIKPSDVYKEVKTLEIEIKELKKGVRPSDVYEEVQRLQSRLDLLQQSLVTLETGLAPLIAKAVEQELNGESPD